MEEQHGQSLDFERLVRLLSVDVNALGKHIWHPGESGVGSGLLGPTGLRLMGGM